MTTNKPHSDVSEVHETEDELIRTAQNAVSRCNWVLGECASKWTKKYAKGRTDADFSALVGLSGDQVYQRRRVWETFGDVCKNYPSLRWSHFYVALNWSDAPECLQWSEENEATVAEMKAWRRAQRGEDLTTDPPPDEWAGDPNVVSFVPSEPTAVRDPSTVGDTGDRGAAGSFAATGDGSKSPGMVAGVARGADQPDGQYAPFRRGAGSPAPEPETSDVDVAEKPRLSAEQLIKRMTSTLVRINRSLTAEVAKEFKHLPEQQRQKFIKAISELSSKAAELM